VKIAFVGSHGVRKTTAAFALAAALRHRGVATEVVHEVVRANPLGFKERATAEAQLWTLLTQVRLELELAQRAIVLVTDRAIVDNYAYAIRVWAGQDPWSIEPFVREWSRSYDLVVRLLPDVPLEADGVRSVDPTFRADIEHHVDRLLPVFIEPRRITTMPASAVVQAADWTPLVTRIEAMLANEASKPQDPTRS
jgi:nicotinamide riboside kinase